MADLQRIYKRDMSRDEWLALRNRGIGSSDAAATAGLSRYLTPYKLWMVKTGQMESPDLSNNPFVYWGTVHEPAIARRFAELHPEYAVRNTNFMFWREDQGYPAFANLDRIARAPGEAPALLEIKTGDKFVGAQWGEPGTAEIPDEYYLQVQHQFLVMGERYQKAYVPVLIGGNDYREYVVHRDDDAITDLVTLERQFWVDNVLAMKAPDVQTLEDVTLRWPRTTASAVEADEGVALVASRYRKAKALSKRLEDRIEELKVPIAAYLGDRDTLTVNGKPYLTYKTEQAESVDVAALRAQRPDIVAQFPKTTVKRTLRLSKI